MIKAGVVGGTGQVGVELLRLLVMHPNVRIQAVTSRRCQGQRVQDVFPCFRHHFDATYVAPEPDNLAGCNVVFFATPPGVAMAMAPALIEKKIRVIDLSEDFRINDASIWQALHGTDHAAPGWLAEAVPGLPELHRPAIRRARLVSMPGCHATATLLALAPLAAKGLAENTPVIVDMKIGIDRPDRRPEDMSTPGHDNVVAYGLDNPRHEHECRAALKNVFGLSVPVSLVRHQVPQSRGMLATIYIPVPGTDTQDLQHLYAERYADEPFIDVVAEDENPATISVRGSSMLRLAVRRRSDGGVILMAAMDALGKGAAGQAVQCMNLIFGIPESIGLRHLALTP